MIARSWGFKSPLAHKVLLDQPRPRRRVAGRFVWPIVVTATAVVALLVAGAGRDTRAELDYLTALHEQAGQLALSGDSLRHVIGRLARIDRPELERLVAEIEADLGAGLDLVTEGAPSPALFAVNSLYRQALLSWQSGLIGFAGAVLSAAEDPASTVVVDNVANALAELRTGDLIYRDLTAEVARVEVPDPVSPLPEVVMMPAEGGLTSLAQAYVTAARAPNNRLALHPGLTVSQVVSDPEWVVNPADQVVVPATDFIVFSVVVSNTGNVDSEGRGLTLEVIGGAEPVELTAEVRPLLPGEQTTVIFDPVPVEPGAAYEVIATLETDPVDVSAEDDRIAVVFLVNEA